MKVTRLVIVTSDLGNLQEGIIFFDEGSSCSLITRHLAGHLHLPARQVFLLIKTFNGIKEFKTVFYAIDLADMWGMKYTIRA